MSKLNVDKHIDVEIKPDELDLTSAESKATYKQTQIDYLKERIESEQIDGILRG